MKKEFFGVAELVAGEAHISQEMHDVVTALRGPDSDSAFAHACKRLATLYIRSMAGDGGISSARIRPYNYAAALYLIRQLDAMDGARPSWWGHWVRHIYVAINALLCYAKPDEMHELQKIRAILELINASFLVTCNSEAWHDYMQQILDKAEEKYSG